MTSLRKKCGALHCHWVWRSAATIANLRDWEVLLI